jgi:hypothetical protein
MEPYCENVNQNWGIKTWGSWADPAESNFLEVKNNKKSYNTCTSLLKENYEELSKMEIIKSKNYISTICGPKYFDPGHIKRIDFLKYIESKNESNNKSKNESKDQIKIDIYGTDNTHNFKNYVRSLSSEEKSVGLIPYKYYFMVENNKEKNYITEKFWEAIMCESLIFYDGAPNIIDYINSNAFVQLDLNDFDKSYNIIVNSINNNLWEKRIDIIKYEKYRVLNYFNFFPRLERIITKDIWSNILVNKVKIYIIETSNIELPHVKVFKDTLEEFGFIITNIKKNSSNNFLLLYLYKNIELSGDNNSLIIYDNMILDSSLNNFFNHIKYLPTNYDYVQLYQNTPSKITYQYNSLYYHCKKYYFESSYAYFISKNGIVKILNYINKKIDYKIKDLIYDCYENIEEFNFYSIYKNNLFIKK